MSNCWCKCEAGIGQCGPKVPRLKSLFNAHKHSDELSLRRGDRQAELQVVWEQIGEDKAQRLEELRQVIAVAVDKAYDRALEESIRRKSAIEESVTNSEKRLKDMLGPYDVKAVAPRDLPLQTRLDNNMARLHELDSARVGGYGWVGGLLVMVELRRRLIVLRETLKLPPCDTSADLDEVLMNTMDALCVLYPGKVSPLSSFKLPSGDQKAGEQKPIFQRLKRFYQALRAMENTWIESFAQKSSPSASYNSVSDGESSDEERFANSQDGAGKGAQVRIQVLQEKRSFWDRSRDSNRQGKESSPLTSMAPFHYLQRSTRSKLKNSKNKITKKKSHISDEACALEQLSHKIFCMLEELNKHAKVAVQTSSDQGSPASPELKELLQPGEASVQSGHEEEADATSGCLPEQQDQDSESCSFRKGSSTPTSVLPPTSDSIQSYHVHIGAVPLLWPPSALIFEQEVQQKPVQKGNPGNRDAVPPGVGKDFSPEPSMFMGFNPIPASKVLPKKDMKPVCVKGVREPPLFMNFSPLTPGMFSSVDEIKPVDLFGASKESPKGDQPDYALQALADEAPAKKGSSLASTAPKTKDAPSKLVPLPPPQPPPPPFSKAGPIGSAPPPPPPPPPPTGKGLVRTKKPAKLRRSSKMGVMYRTMKSRLEGRIAGQVASPASGGSQQKASSGSSSQGGMAEALAEITKRSAYFQKIEDDVQQHAECILETKVAIESFQTSNMDQLLRFHESVEIQLEDLTDETQVLARFEGFPSKKLETIRLAAALYSKLLCMAQHVERWKLEGPAAGQLDKVYKYFEKVKKEVEAVERNEDDAKRFSGHKIQFDFSIIVRIKEGMVALASRCVVVALEDSRRVKSMTIQSCGGSNPSYEANRMKTCLQMLWGAFQLSYRVYNFAGGCDEATENLTSELANEMETYPSSVWL